MNEQQFIYGKLNYLTEQVENLTDLLERQQEVIGGLVNIVEKMQSPAYASKQMSMAKMADVAEKIKFIRNLNKK